MNPEIGEEDRGEPGHNRDQHAARQRVLQPAPHDVANAEEPVTKNRVGERHRKREPSNGAKGRDRRRECRITEHRVGARPIRHHDRQHADETNRRAECQHANATTLGDVGQAPIAGKQRAQRGRRVARGDEGDEGRPVSRRAGPVGPIHRARHEAQLQEQRQRHRRPDEQPHPGRTHKRTRKNHEKRQQHRSHGEAAGEWQPQRHPQQRRQRAPGCRDLVGRIDRKHREGGQQPSTDARRHIERPFECHHEHERERDELHPSRHEQVRPGGRRPETRRRAGQPQYGLPPLAAACNLQSKRPPALQVHRDREPIEAISNRQAIGGQDAIAGLQPGIRRRRTGRHGFDHHRRLVNF